MKNVQQTTTSHSCLLLVIHRDLSSRESMERTGSWTPLYSCLVMHSFSFHSSSFSSSLEESRRSRNTAGHTRLWNPPRSFRAIVMIAASQERPSIRSPVLLNLCIIQSTHPSETSRWSLWITNICCEQRPISRCFPENAGRTDCGKRAGKWESSTYKCPKCSNLETSSECVRPSNTEAWNTILHIQHIHANNNYTE